MRTRNLVFRQERDIARTSGRARPPVDLRLQGR